MKVHSTQPMIMLSLNHIKKLAFQKVVSSGIIVLTGFLYLTFPAVAQDNIIHTWDAENENTSLNSVFFVDADTGWAVGLETILHTNDGGESWVEQESEWPLDLYSVHFVDSQNGWAAGNYTFMYTSNGGSNWEIEEDLPAGVSRTYFRSVYFTDSETGWIVGTDGIILHTSDGGENWIVQESNTESFLLSVYFTDTDNGWIAGHDGIILHTSNGGATWEEQESGSTEVINEIHFVDSETGWAVGDGRVILHTSDGGDNWALQDSTNSLKSVHFINGNTGWAVGGSNTFLYTNDGGEIWMEQNDIVSTYSERLRSVHFVDAENGWAVGSAMFRYRPITLSPPELLEPNNKALVESPVHIYWQEELHPEFVHFNLHVSTKPDFSDTLHYEPDLTENSQIFELSSNSTYYWRVRRQSIKTPERTSDWISRQFFVNPDFFRVIGDSIHTGNPNYVNIILHALDEDYNSITGLSKDSFELSENGSSISPTESYYQVSKLDQILEGNKSFKTVMMLDNSLSIGEENLDFIKNAARKFIGNISSRQEISLYVFADGREQMLPFTNDKQALLNAVDSIALTNIPGTDLYSAAIEGLQQWEDEFSLTSIEQGVMLLFTDGRDLAGRHTLEEVLAERGSKQVYAVGVELDPDDFDEDALKQIGNGGTFIGSGFENLVTHFAEVQQRMEEFGNSFYWLNYASASRSTNTELNVRVKNNINNDTDAEIHANFDASKFYSVPREITINGSAEEPVGVDTLTMAGDETVTVKIETVFAYEPQPFEFTISDPEKLLIEPHGSEAFTFNLYANGVEGDEVEVTIRDTVQKTLDLEKILKVTFTERESGELEPITVNKIQSITAADGGTVADEVTGASVDIPAGGMEADTDIEIGIYNELPSGADLAGALAYFGPSGTTFAEPVKITVAYDPDHLPPTVENEEDLVLLRYNDDSDSWDAIETTVNTENKTVSGFTDHFSGFAAGYIKSQINTNTEISFGGSSSSEDYRLVALPGAVSEPLKNIFEGEAGINWQAYYDDGTDDDYLKKHDGSELFTLTTGNGFWVTGKESFQYSGSIEVVDLNSENQAVIPLHEGWNIISNPIDEDIAWADVISANDVSLQSIWSFDGSFQESDEFISAKSGQAFYFLNDQALEELLIPAVSNASKENPQKYLQGLEILTTVDNRQTSISDLNFLDARESVMRDIVAPPDNFEEASLRFATENPSRRNRKLARIFRKLNNGGLSIPVLLTATPGATVNVRINPKKESLFTEAVLVNEETGELYDLTSDPGATLTTTHQETSLLLITGDSEYVKQERGKYLPQEFEVKANYPNPFNPTTTLRFSLPQQSQVRLQVYDTIGRRVAVLINDVRQAGVHSVVFDASRHASGLYFAVFEIGDQRFTQKMMLIK